MENKKVSVIVPVYNVEKYIDSCVQSILGQTYSNIELILVNDGSCDRSGSICEGYSYQYDNVIYKCQSNSGVSAARNAGLDIATGEYVIFVDSDDRIKSNMISSLVDTIEKTQADLCICGYDAVYSDYTKQIIVDANVVSGKEGIARYFADHFADAITSAVWCKLYKRLKINHRFDLQFSRGEDLLFNLGYIKQADLIVTISENLYVYDKTNDASLTHNYKEVYHEQNMFLFKQWLNWFNEYENVNDVWVHYRIVNLYLYRLIYVCSEKTPGKKLDLIRSMLDNDLDVSIQKAKRCFGLAHKILLSLILHRCYRLMMFVVIAYCKLKSIN